MILHTVNKSVFDNNALGDCLRVVTSTDVILLIENGVYGALNKPQSEPGYVERIQALSADGTGFYVLQADCQARGLQDRALLPAFKITDDAGFVDLASAASAIQSWY
ncbi:hypothetical protein A9Q89_11095 [Gammaproteobacteria bacterium 53_120_T64]|nr:hypothetical protein A9Q89_11095 [Gammaproteobacteria bacterium 53_120_T64]